MIVITHLMHAFSYKSDLLAGHSTTNWWE